MTHSTLQPTTLQERLQSILLEMVTRERSGDVIDRSLMRSITMVRPTHPPAADVDACWLGVYMFVLLGSWTSVCCCRCWWIWGWMCTRTSLSAAFCRQQPRLIRWGVKHAPSCHC